MGFIRPWWLFGDLFHQKYLHSSTIVICSRCLESDVKLYLFLCCRVLDPCFPATSCNYIAKKTSFCSRHFKGSYGKNGACLYASLHSVSSLWVKSRLHWHLCSISSPACLWVCRRPTILQKSFTDQYHSLWMKLRHRLNCFKAQK